MFSADELLSEGNSYVSYYGYDTRGNEINSEVTLEDFFTNKVSTPYGEYYDRLIPAFQPTYVAGFIQDKFAFDDLIFNVGLRVDRYDANQQVLKDRYLLHDAYTAGEATDFSHPASVENDYVVYVDDFTNPTKVTGIDQIIFGSMRLVKRLTIRPSSHRNLMVMLHLILKMILQKEDIKHLKIMSQKRFLCLVSLSLSLYRMTHNFSHTMMSLLNVHQPQIDWTQRNIFI